MGNDQYVPQITRAGARKACIPAARIRRPKAWLTTRAGFTILDLLHTKTSGGDMLIVKMDAE